MTETSNSKTARAHAALAELNSLLGKFDFNVHAQESASIADLIVNYIRPSGADHLVGLASAILDEKINETIDSFLAATKVFYNTQPRAVSVALSTDLVARLNHDRNELSRSPSVELARELQSIFSAFASSHPLQPQEKHHDEN